MRGEPVELNCPFCSQGKIQAWYIPGVMGQRTRSTSTFGRIKEKTKSSDVWLIKSGCDICKKSVEEVEKELKSNGTI